MASLIEVMMAGICICTPYCGKEVFAHRQVTHSPSMHDVPRYQPKSLSSTSNMFFHTLNIPVEPPPPSDAEDTETLLSPSKTRRRVRRSQDERSERDLCVALKACVLSSCVWLLVIVVIFNTLRKRLLLEATDQACLGHISKYCEKLHWVVSRVRCR